MDRPGEPYLIISMDSHVGFSMRGQLRQYCPAGLLDDFDAFVGAVDAENEKRYAVEQAGDVPYPASFQRPLDRMRDARGSYDAQVRLADLDEQGMAAEVMFAGSLNGEMVPFVGVGFKPPRVGSDADLVAAGSSIFNRGLADFCSADPTRLLGAMQVSIWDSTMPSRRSAGVRTRVCGWSISRLLAWITRPTRHQSTSRCGRPARSWGSPWPPTRQVVNGPLGHDLHIRLCHGRYRDTLAVSSSRLGADL